MNQREGLASVSLWAAKTIGHRLVAKGRLENLSNACRVGLRRLQEDARIVDRLILFGEEGMTRGLDEAIAIDAFAEAKPTHL